MKKSSNFTQYLPHKTKILVILILGIFVVSCRTTNTSKRFKIFDNYIVENQLKEQNRITNFIFRNWSYLDNRHIILTSSHRQSYLISFLNYCDDLEYTQQIALKQAISSQLDAKFDAILVPQQQIQQECRIQSIHQISLEQQNELQKLDSQK